MLTKNWPRRTVLAGGAAIALTRGAAAQQVVWSTGTERPKTKAPPGATDCHHHIYDARFPVAPGVAQKPGDATVTEYRVLQKRIGTTRNVIVLPSAYGVDNSCLVDALAQFGTRNTRGVAVVNTGVTDAELHRLHKAGVRGIRFNLAPAGATTVEMIEPLSHRVVKLGWHIQINMTSDMILANAAIWDRVPAQIVFDHLAHLREPDGVKDPAFAVVSALADEGQGMGKTVRRLCGHQGRASDLCRQHRGGAGLRETGAATAGLGQRLAASVGKGGREAGRRAAVRPAVAMDAGRGHTAPDPGEQPGPALWVRVRKHAGTPSQGYRQVAKAGFLAFRQLIAWGRRAYANRTLAAPKPDERLLDELFRRTPLLQPR